MLSAYETESFTKLFILMTNDVNSLIWSISVGSKLTRYVL